MAEKVTYLTKQGKEELEAYLVSLKGEKSAEIVKRIDIARGFGDLSENSEYDEARQAQTDNNAEIARVEELLKNVEIIEESGKTDKVQMGLVVTLESLANGKVDDYYIVGESETDPFNKYISNESPLGSALIGKKVGAVVSITVPAGVREYKILKIKKKGK